MNASLQADAPAPVAPEHEPSPILATGAGSEPVAPGVWILHGQGHSLVFELDAGLVLVDAGPGGKITRGMIAALRAISDAPLLAICFSHGHIGYNAGVEAWLAHARERGDPAPRCIAHANLPRRVARYRETMPLQERMAEIQFRRGYGTMQGRFPAPMPTETFDTRLCIGDPAGRRLELLWAPSETDDAIAAWYPSQGVLYGGPAVIDSIPNIGTPFRTMRDTVRWADTLEHLAALGASLVVREFGASLVGEPQVQLVLLQTARALRWVRAEVVRLMNEGLGERQILATLLFPPELFEVPWMKATYGDPYWIARDVYRSENGWWDRNPTNLHPAAPGEVAAEVARAITDKQAVLDHARALAAQGKVQLALHVVDLLAALDGEAAEIVQARRLKAEWLRQRASEVRSYVSKSIFHGSAAMLADGQKARFGIS